MCVVPVISANMLTANVLLIVFFFSGQFPGALACLVWSNLFLTVPQKMEALGGSCLQIPCYFWARYKNDFDDSKTFGVWIKRERNFDQNPVVFNSSGSVNTYPMKMIGNLNQKNCTTLFSHLNTTYSGQYLFRVEKWPFKETALCDRLQLTVTNFPPSPRIEISGDLKENQSVTVTCSALTPCPRWPPKLTWNLQKDSHNHMEQNTDGNFTTKIQESITLSEQHDGYNISCSAAYPVNEGEEEKTAEETKTLSVSCQITSVSC
ncbi:myelin-associated glycoprotein-like [Halichoeres trimaculatus]|uniref:myelin-associated glycoprotein-like n=1 Tax=Halichoeres trimaculatus TaxID=147232 RepID=UPI003D9EBAD2